MWFVYLRVENGTEAVFRHSKIKVARKHAPCPHGRLGAPD